MRRQPFRRRPGRRAPAARPSVPPAVRRRLARARGAVEQRRFVEAGGIYKDLARSAYAHGRIRPGIHMSLEAGRCYLRANDLEKARTTVLRVARRAAEVGRPGLCRPLAERIVQRLEQAGHEADAFREEIAALLGSSEPRQTSGVGRRTAGTLPGSCPACSAPLHPEEIEWVADDRVTCPYCGTIVVAE